MLYSTRVMMKKKDSVINHSAGARTDFEQLLKRFTDAETVRYDSFAEIWRDMKMTFIFAGRLNDRETREFTEDCFHIAIQYYLPPYNFQVRVGGLYLMYGLYISQPLISKAKIRVTLEQWQEIMNFQSEVHRQEHLDVEYVFYKLQLKRAFEYCATTLEIFPTDKSSTFEETGNYEQFKAEESLLYDLFSADVLEQMAAVHQHYHRIKVRMEGDRATKPSKALDVIQEDLVPSITKAIVHYQDKRKNENKSVRKRGFAMDDDEDADINDADYRIYDNEDSYGRSKKKRLKAKAFQNTLTSRRRAKKRTVFKEESTEEEGVSPTKQKKKKTMSKNSIFEEDEFYEAAQLGYNGEMEGVALSMPVLEEETSIQKKHSSSTPWITRQRSKKDTSFPEKESGKMPRSKRKVRKNFEYSSSPQSSADSKIKEYDCVSTERYQKSIKSPKSVLKKVTTTSMDSVGQVKNEEAQVSPSKESNITITDKSEINLTKEENSPPKEADQGKVTLRKGDKTSEIIKKQRRYSEKKSSGKKLSIIISSLEKKRMNEQAKKLDFDSSNKECYQEDENFVVKKDSVADLSEDTLSTKVITERMKRKRVMPTIIPLLDHSKKELKRKKKS